MNMVRLLYASTVADNFDPAELDNILNEARERNTREDMTGILFFTTSHFIQCLEGDRKAVNMLYNDMMKDPRHHSLVLLSYEDISERMFSSWQMAYIGPNDIEQGILRAHSLTPEFEPCTMDQEWARAVLIMLVGHIEPQSKEMERQP